MPEKKPKAVWKRVLLLFVIVMVVFGVIGTLVDHVSTVRMVRDLAQIDPALSITPTPLANVAIADAAGWSSHTFGPLVLKTPEPWHDERKRGNVFSVSLGDCGGVIAMTHTHYPGGPKSETLPPNSRSYDYVVAEMNALPSQAGFLRTDANNSRIVDFIGSKLPDVLESSTAIHPIAFGRWRGFQVDMTTPKRAYIHRLILFDEGNQRLDLFFKSSPGSDFTQPELNAIVATLQEPSVQAAPALPVPDRLP